MPRRGVPPADLDVVRDLADVLAEFAHTLGTEFSIHQTLEQLVQRLVEILPISGAGILLVPNHEPPNFVAASNDIAGLAQSLETELQEGPCLPAYRDNQPVSVPNLATDTRFPRFSAAAAAAGIRAATSVPLRMHDRRLGALDLYRDVVGPLSDEEMRTAQVLADAAAAHLFNAQARTELAETVATFEYRALHDPLTGLANRALLQERLTDVATNGGRSPGILAVLFIDLDGFKTVNDSFGHQIGDRLLMAVATRLRQAVRPGDTLARLYGDEFAVLCENLTAASDAEVVAKRIAASIARPFQLDGLSVEIAASVGLSYRGPGEAIPDTLLREADSAMYEAKREGGARHRTVGDTSRRTVQWRKQLKQDLHLALERK